MPELSVADPNFVQRLPATISSSRARLTFASARPGRRGQQYRAGRRQCQLHRPPFADRAARARLRAAPLRSARRHVRHARSSISARRSAARSSTSSPTASGSRRRDPNAPARRSRSRSSSISTAPRPSRSAPRCARACPGGREAFDAAGYVDAFRAEILPEGADPLDVRYNVVNWVNRATRGWSYGQPIVDPRTGEIIKGQVLLGSLRVRQDMIIYQALVGAGADRHRRPQRSGAGRARAHPPARRARGRPRARLRPQFRGARPRAAIR